MLTVLAFRILKRRRTGAGMAANSGYEASYGILSVGNQPELEGRSKGADVSIQKLHPIYIYELDTSNLHELSTERIYELESNRTVANVRRDPGGTTLKYTKPLPKLPTEANGGDGGRKSAKSSKEMLSSSQGDCKVIFERYCFINFIVYSPFDQIRVLDPRRCR